MYNLAIRKCTSPPLLAPRLIVFKLKFTTPLGIEPRTCWTWGRHATIWAKRGERARNCWSYSRHGWECCENRTLRPASAFPGAIPKSPFNSNLRIMFFNPGTERGPLLILYGVYTREKQQLLCCCFDKTALRVKPCYPCPGPCCLSATVMHTDAWVSTLRLRISTSAQWQVMTLTLITTQILQRTVWTSFLQCLVIIR